MERAEKGSDLSPAMRRLGEFLANTDEKKLVRLSVTELAAAARVSEATVLRWCRKFGFKGYSEFRVTLAREGKACLEEPPKDFAYELQAEYLAVFARCCESADPPRVKRAAELVLGAGKVCCFAAAGKEYAAVALKNGLLEMGIFAVREEDAQFRNIAISACGESDLLIAVGKDEETERAAQLARAHGMKILSLGGESRFADCALTAVCEGERGERLALYFLAEILCAAVYRTDRERFEIALAKSSCAVAGSKG